MGHWLPLIRLQLDERTGLAPEPGCLQPYHEAQHAYFAKRFAKDVSNKRVSRDIAVLIEFDAKVRVNIVGSHYNLDNLLDYMEIIDGYQYPPHGIGAIGFGYRSDSTAAWLIVPGNDSDPALMFKTGCDTDIDKYAAYWLTAEAPLVHPRPEDFEFLASTVKHRGRKRLHPIRLPGRGVRPML